MPSSIPVLFTLFALVVPGFLIHSVMSVFTTRHAARAEASWVYPISIGAMNVAVWSWLIYLLLTLPVFRGPFGRRRSAGGTWVAAEKYRDRRRRNQIY